VIDDRRKVFWHNWGCIVIALGVLSLVSFCSALSEKRPVGAFAEILLSLVIIFVMPFVCFFAACLVKEKIEDITGRRLAFVLGIITFFVLMLAMTWAWHRIPGVNWRIHKTLDEMPDN
jgi:uncharacterized membrane protein